MAKFDTSLSRSPIQVAKSTDSVCSEHYIKSVACNLRTKFSQSRASENLAEREWIAGLWSGSAVQRFLGEPRKYWGFSALFCDQRIFSGKQLAEGMGLISNLLHVGNELESRRVQPARRGIFLR